MRGARSICLLLCALLVGCGAQAEPSAPPDKLGFTAKTIDGKDFSGASLKGRTALLWFWVPWCPTCQREAPVVASEARARVNTMDFVGVAAQDQLPAMKDFAAKYGLDQFPQLADLDASIWARFEVTHQPSYAFLHPDGTVEVVKDQLSDIDLGHRLDELTKPW